MNTLAQNGTSGVILLSGTGSDLSNDKAVKGRAKRKMIINQIALSLVDAAKSKEHTDRLQTYWNTFHCQSRIYTADGKLYGRYCKNRCCLLCLSIRKADIINRYLPLIQGWEDPHLVTITAKAVPLERIAKRMRSLINGFQKITNK